MTSTHDTAGALLPCPFCGETPDIASAVASATAGLEAERADLATRALALDEALTIKNHLLATERTAREAAERQADADQERMLAWMDRAEATERQVEALRAALEKIAKNEEEVFDEGEQALVMVAMDMEDAAKIAVGALSAHPAHETAPARDGWRPIAEAPKTGEEFLVWESGKGEEFDTVSIAFWRRNGFVYQIDDHLHVGDDALWQPLPAAPAQEGTDGR